MQRVHDVCFKKHAHVNLSPQHQRLKYLSLPSCKSGAMVNITIRIPVTMRIVRRNGTTASFNHNRRGERYTRTINGYISDQIRAIEASSAGLSYDQLDARVSEVARNIIRNKQTRLNYDRVKEHCLEDEDDCDDPMAGDVEAANKLWCAHGRS